MYTPFYFVSLLIILQHFGKDFRNAFSSDFILKSKNYAIRYLIVDLRNVFIRTEKLFEWNKNKFE